MPKSNFNGATPAQQTKGQCRNAHYKEHSKQRLGVLCNNQLRLPQSLNYYTPLNSVNSSSFGMVPDDNQFEVAVAHDSTEPSVGAQYCSELSTLQVEDSSCAFKVGQRSLYNRLRTVNKGKALPSSSTERFDWKKEGKILQSRYDDGHYLPHIPRSVKRTWRSAIIVRRELQKHGADQRKLLRGKEALSAKGVIYAIMSMGSQKIYVGQTVKSALERFQQHVSTARRGETTPLHVHIRQVGIGKIYIVPLEMIPTSRYTGIDGKVDNSLFRSVATPREKFWIERLHSYTPRGYNVEWAGRKRHRHRVKNNPMKWAKHKNVDSHLSNPISESKTLNEDLTNIPLTASAESDIHSYQVVTRSRSKKALEMSQAPSIPVPNNEKMGMANNENLKQNVTSYSSRQFGYRDWERRCRYLIQLYNKDCDLLSKVCWEGYAPRNLWRMISFLEREKHDFQELASKYVIEMIRSQLLLRARSVPQKRKNGKLSISLEWTSQLLRAIPLAMLLKSSESKSLFPGNDTTVLDELSVARKLVKPIGRTLFNYSTVSRKLDAHTGSTETSCQCRTLFPTSFRPSDGCVLTGDLNIVQSKSLRDLIMLGPKVRTHTCANPMEAIHVALDEFISKVSNSQAIPKTAFTAWKHLIISACETRLKAANVYGGYGSKNKVVMGRKDLNYLSRLQHFLVLVPVDKAANNVAFICKRLYVCKLRQEFESENQKQNSENVYEISEEGSEVVIARHTHRLKSFYNFEHTPEKLAYLYWMPKLHKNPTSERFIAAAFACTTTQLSKLMSDCLTKILATLREKDDANILKTGIRRMFVVSGYEEVVAFLSRWPRVAKGSRTDDNDSELMSCRQLRTGDFSTMYTTIPHNDLTEKMSVVINEAWEWVSKSREVDSVAGQLHERIALRWTRDSGKNVCEWEVTRARTANFEHSSELHKFTKSDLITAVTWLIGNTFLVNGGICRRQAIGIPMGTNCAPTLANLYLYAYESAYIDKLLASSHEAIATQFHMTFRLIDDVLSVDNPYWTSAISASQGNGGMYPAALSLNDTTINSQQVRFLGMSICDIGGKLSFDVFDKRREFPFTVCRYPHKCSMIPTYIAYGVFTGLLHRYYRICTQFSQFVLNASLLARTLIKQGWMFSRLRIIFRRFIQSRLGLKWKHPLSNMCMEFARQAQLEQ